MIRILLASLVFSQAVLEPADNSGIYLGAWYDRLNGDTPVKVNMRLNYKPLPFFQSDMNITDSLQSEAVDNFIDQVEATETDAFVYLTIYPMNGFDGLSDNSIDQLAQKIKKITDLGRKCMLRFARYSKSDLVK
jgi:hypothetical protein